MLFSQSVLLLQKFFSMPESMRLFGLTGYPLSHSFSKKYFTEKFEKEGFHHCRYELFPLESIQELPQLLHANPQLEGLNVTIPYKQTVMQFLDEIQEEAAEAGAVNTIKIVAGKVKGYNTDTFGFEQSLKEMIGDRTPRALVLGSGGASKAVVYILKKLNIPYLLVSRSADSGDLIYEELNGEIIRKHKLIIQSTPLGMFPAINSCPPLPYEAMGDDHFAFDLVYNPAETLFLKRAAESGAKTRNGLQMLHLQAEKAWQIWNNQS